MFSSIGDFISIALANIGKNIENFISNIASGNFSKAISEAFQTGISDGFESNLELPELKSPDLVDSTSGLLDEFEKRKKEFEARLDFNFERFKNEKVDDDRGRDKGLKAKGAGAKNNIGQFKSLTQPFFDLQSKLIKKSGNVQDKQLAAQLGIRKDLQAVQKELQGRQVALA